MENVTSVKNVTSKVASDAGEVSENRTRFAFWFIALAFGLLVALSRRDFVNPDGLSYLDMGDAFWRRDWRGAINGLWSPMYGWLLGLVLNLFRVGPRWESLTVHLVNFGIYAMSLLSFDFFLRTLITYHHANVRRYGNTFATLPTWVWYGLGFTLFIWSAVNSAMIFSVTPDLLNSAFLYLASGLLVRIRTEFMGLRPSGLLGVVLGLGYLTRASMFPLAFVFLGVALASAGDFRRSLPALVLELVVFLLVSAPFIAGLSWKEGHLTLGESAKLNYAYSVGGVTRVYWQGGPPGCGRPRHPARKILETPPVYEFGTPIVATYPLAFDPPYWYDGVVPCFDLRGQLTVLMASARQIFDISLGQVSALPVAIIALAYWGHSTGHGRLLIKGLVDNVHLLAIACAGLAVHVWAFIEPRYIATFVTLLWMGIFSAVRLPRVPESTQIVRAIMVGLIAVMLAMIGRNTLDEVQSALRSYPPDTNWEIAEGLGRMGIRPGDKIAVFGTSYHAYWARLARVRIVAEIPNSSRADFWAADPAIQARAINALLSSGAKAIIAEDVPSTSDLIGWKRIGATGFFIYPGPR